MPIKRIDHSTIDQSDSRTRLVSRIRKEFGADETPVAPTADRPHIIEETMRTGIKHVTVVWDDEEWHRLSYEERGRVILEAYSQEFGEETMLKISIAVGLTAAEAEKMKIEV